MGVTKHKRVEKHMKDLAGDIHIHDIAFKKKSAISSNFGMAKPDKVDMGVTSWVESKVGWKK